MKTTHFIFIVLFLFGGSLFAQQSAGNYAVFTVSGTVFDQGTGKPMEYATVALLAKPDSNVVTGTISGSDGKFLLETRKPGNYILKVGFIGFERYTNDITLNRSNPTFSAGEIRLHPITEDIDEVTVEANSSSIEYKIDKKVVHVGENYSAVSGNAVDVLENVPSIQVDIEGNVSLRGNSNFTVLIDDRPTVLDANEALQQIPAAMIQDIEIITNPSAKYDPEGTAGIINIITKKRSLQGLSGIVHANAGLDEKYGADFLLNYRTEHFNFFVGADYRKYTYPGTVTEEMHTYTPDDTAFLASEGDYSRGFSHYSARAGIEWFPNDKNTLSISGRYGGRAMEGLSTTTFNEWRSSDLDRNIYSSDESWQRSGNFYGINADYSLEFSSRHHKLDLQVMYFYRESDEESYNTLLDQNNDITNGQRSTESGPGGGWNYRINYKQPFSDAFKIEAGAQGRIRAAEETNEMFYYNTTNQLYELQDLYSHDVNYNRNIHALYALALGEKNNFGYQLGLRTEYTYRDIFLDQESETFNINRWDLFPTVHFSYQLPNKNQLLASYTRRIDRPRGWYLEPFLTWQDAYNVRQGNPGLQPEYINSYEIAYQKEFKKKHSVSLEVYYRTTENRVERIRSVYDESIMLHTYENVGTDYALGTELMVNIKATKWWETNLSANFYDYRVKGQLNEIDFDKHSFTWSARWNNIIKIGKTTRLQITPSYRSPEVEAQEKDAGYFAMNAALRQNLFENKIDLTLQVRDVFATAKHESEIDANDFYSFRLYEHKAPIVMLNLTWRINNYKNRKGRQQGGGDDDGGFEGGEM